MNCVRCGKDTFVTDARPSTDGMYRRRRSCEGCGERFTTYELSRESLRGHRAKVTDEIAKRVSLITSLAQEIGQLMQPIEPLTAIEPEESPPVDEAKPESKPNKLDWQCVADIRRRNTAGEGVAKLALEYGVTRQQVHNIVKGYSWPEEMRK